MPNSTIGSKIIMSTFQRSPAVPFAKGPLVRISLGPYAIVWVSKVSDGRGFPLISVYNIAQFANNCVRLVKVRRSLINTAHPHQIFILQVSKTGKESGGQWPLDGTVL